MSFDVYVHVSIVYVLSIYLPLLIN